MKKDTILYLVIVFTIIGPCLTGLGIGKIFNRPFVGTSIGLGLGLTITALILFKIFRRIHTYEKN
jgi:hypothetical protein